MSLLLLLLALVSPQQHHLALSLYGGLPRWQERRPQLLLRPLQEDSYAVALSVEVKGHRIFWTIKQGDGVRSFRRFEINADTRTMYHKDEARLFTEQEAATVIESLESMPTADERKGFWTLGLLRYLVDSTAWWDSKGEPYCTTGRPAWRP